MNRIDVQRLERQLRLIHFQLLAALSREQKLTSAAARLKVSQPAASRILREIEELLGLRLHRKEGRGLSLTPEGIHVARLASHVVSEICAFAEEVRDIEQGIAGSISVGSVTEPAVIHLLQALRVLRLQAPAVRVHIDINTSDVLVPKLLAGDFDFVLARRVPTAPRSRVEEIVLATEAVEFVVRTGHPLTALPHVELDRMLEFDWVLPPQGQILRNTVESFLAKQGLPNPKIITSTSSFLMTLALISRTNAIAPLAAGVRRTFDGQGIVALQTVEAHEVEPYSMIWRRGESLSFAALGLVDLLAVEFPGLRSEYEAIRSRR